MTAFTRRSLMAAGATLALTAFNVHARQWVTAGQPQVGVPVPPLDGELTMAPEALDEASTDYGHLVSQAPYAVLRPGSIEDIAQIIVYAEQIGVKVAPRGLSHSTIGQALTDGGIVIDLETFGQVLSVDSAGAWVEGGAKWRDLLLVSLAQGLMPRVMPDYLELTVGGVLSVGGIGGAAHRVGLTVDNVLELDVVTGRGRIVRCSRHRQRRLFEAVLGGLGQYGVIARAKIALEPAVEMARVYQLVYFELGSYLADQRTLALDGRFTQIEGQVIPSPTGEGWAYLIEAMAGYSAVPPDNDALLAGLAPSLVLDILDLPIVPWLDRVTPYIEGLKEIGLHETPHPWLDLFLPDDQVQAYIAAQVARLSPEDVGAGLVLLYPFRRSRLSRTSMVMPEGHDEVLWLFDILRIPPGDDSLVAAQMADNRVRNDEAVAVGGKRYPISAVQYDTADWCAHFGREAEL